MRTGYGRDCHMEAAFGPSVTVGSEGEGGVWREHFERSLSIK